MNRSAVMRLLLGMAVGATTAMLFLVDWNGTPARAVPAPESPSTVTNSFAPTRIQCSAVDDPTNSIACPPKLNSDIESGDSGGNY